MAKQTTGRILAASLFCAAAQHALAADDIGFYIGGSFSATRIDSGNGARDLSNELRALGFATADVQFDEKSTGLKILGGYQVNRNFAVEGYIASLGKYDISVLTTGPTVSGSGDVKVTGLGFDAVGILPFNDRWSGLARVGLFMWEAKTNFSASGGGPSSSASGSDDGSDFKFGLGVEWKVGSNVRLRAEWEHYAFDDPVNALSLGIVYKFD